MEVIVKMKKNQRGGGLGGGLRGYVYKEWKLLCEGGSGWMRTLNGLL